MIKSGLQVNIIQYRAQICHHVFLTLVVAREMELASPKDFFGDFQKIWQLEYFPENTGFFSG